MSTKSIAAILCLFVIAGAIYVVLRLDHSANVTGPEKVAQNSINMRNPESAKKVELKPDPPAQVQKIAEIKKDVMSNIDPKEKKVVSKSERVKATVNGNVYELISLASQGSETAVKELINLSRDINDKSLIHQILRAIIKSGTRDGLNAVLDVIEKNLNEPIETLRMCSYLPVQSGKYEDWVTERLYQFTLKDGINPQTKQELIIGIQRYGGEYGREKVNAQFLEIMKANAPHRPSNVK
jgi:hypothetical protein